MIQNSVSVSSNTNTWKIKIKMTAYVQSVTLRVDFMVHLVPLRSQLCVSIVLAGGHFIDVLFLRRALVLSGRLHGRRFWSEKQRLSEDGFYFVSQVIGGG